MTSDRLPEGALSACAAALLENAALAAARSSGVVRFCRKLVEVPSSGASATSSARASSGAKRRRVVSMACSRNHSNL